MGLIRAAVAVAAAVVVVAVVVSGGDGADPRTPRGLPGLPAPLFGTAVIGGDRRTAAIDAYGDIVDLRSPGPVGRALVAVPADRQAAGTVPVDDAIVARMRFGDGRSVPFWRADSVRQRYLPGSNVLRTVARLDGRRWVVVRRIGGPGAVRADRRWLAHTRPLSATAPGWAQAMYRRSLLVLRALTDRRTGAVAAGARDGWAYVWPRDAATVAIALVAAGYRPQARRVARFLSRLDLDSAARFGGNGAPVPGRDAQGDADGWVDAAVRAAGLPPRTTADQTGPWRNRADYQEGVAGDYLGNAIAYTATLSAGGPKTDPYRPESARRREGWIASEFAGGDGLGRIAGEPSSGLDSAAAWAVEPFSLPALHSAARATLLRLAAQSGRFGIVPSENWHGGDDPWTAPTAWSAWALAALAQGNHDPGSSRKDRRAALRLMADLRRAATPLGLLPERVDAHTGAPRSTTPLAWSHAFAILALRELWPGRAVT